MRPITPENAAAIGCEAAAALADLLQPDGRFIYRYMLREPRKVDAVYSPIRHIAAVWFMLQAAHGFPSLGDVRDAALRAGEQIANAFVFPFASDDMLCVLDEGLIKLGGAGLAVATFCAMHDVTGDSRTLQLAERLCRFVLSQRLDNGDFIHIRHYPLSTVHPTRSPFCNGQALLGLLALYRRSGDSRLLDAVNHSLAGLGRGNHGVSINSHWMLHALAAHFEVQPTAATLGYAARIAAGIVDNADYRKSGSLTAIACRTEGLLAYSRLLKLHGRSSIAPGLDVCLRQVRLNLNQLLKFRSTGGVFVESLHKPEVRIDYIQHAGQAFLGYALLGAGGWSPASVGGTNFL